jgi:hypothetical protein
MIPVLIIWLLRRYKQRRNQLRGYKVTSEILNGSYLLIAAVLLAALMLLIAVMSHAQNRQFKYQIVRNGNKVGTLNFSETTNGGMDYLKMESGVRTRFSFTFTAHASEDAVYRDGVLLHSSIYRKLNGNEKVNKQHLHRTANISFMRAII